MSGIELEPWSRAMPLVGRGLIPFVRMVPRPGTPWIRYLRAMSIVFGLSLVLILLVVLQLDGATSQSAQWRIWLWGATSLAAVAGFALTHRSRSAAVINASSPLAAVHKYQQRMFLLIAFSQVPSLVALMVFFAGETLTPYFVSLPISLGLVALGSPSQRDVRRLQEAIVEGGKSLDLAAALMDAPDWTTLRSRRRGKPGSAEI